VNDVGLLAEEGDPRSGELLGNFLQAFSHIGLVNTAWAISQAESWPPESGESAELPISKAGPFAAMSKPPLALSFHDIFVQTFQAFTERG